MLFVSQLAAFGSQSQSYLQHECHEHDLINVDTHQLRMQSRRRLCKIAANFN